MFLFHGNDSAKQTFQTFSQTMNATAACMFVSRLNTTFAKYNIYSDIFETCYSVNR